MASITYDFADPSTGFRATCLIEEMSDGTLRFTIEVDQSTGTLGDLRGMFFEVADQSLLPTLSIAGDDITDSMIRADGVTNLGGGANVEGQVAREVGAFDLGVEIGRSGLKGGADDIQSTQFTISSTAGPLSLAMFENVDTALRVTSVGGEDSRDGSLKLVGDVLTGAVSGRYFFDRDGNDVDNDGDAPVGGKWVTLYMADGVTRAVDAHGNPAAPVLTGADGSYRFANLREGQYVVHFQDSQAEGRAFVLQDEGANDCIDSDVDPLTGKTGLITVYPGSETLNVDAGVKAAPSASISGRYFDDANRNDLDDGEAGLAGMTVTLLDADGAAVAATATAADGGYGFGGLAAGTYRVRFEAADGKVFSAGDMGEDAIDSDVDASGLSNPVALAEGQSIVDLDAGVKSWELTGAIVTASHSVSFVIDATWSTYDVFSGIPPVDMNADGDRNVIDLMLAEIVERAQGLAPDQQIELVLAGAGGVEGRLTLHARDVHGLDARADDGTADAAALRAIFGPAFYKEAGALPPDVDFAAALDAVGDAIAATYGPAGATLNQVVVLTSSDGFDDWTSLPVGDPSAAAQRLAADYGARIDAIMFEPRPWSDPSILDALDSDGAHDSVRLLDGDPTNDGFRLDRLVSDSPAITEGDVIGLLIGGESFDFADPPDGDGRIEVALSGLTVDPSAGVGVTIDTDRDGAADRVVAAEVTVGADGAVRFSLDLTDGLLV